jgi:hypothetical protein
MVRKRMHKLLDQRKQAKLQWLQDQSEINGENLNNIRRETRRHFRNKEREYLKDRIDELATNSANKDIRDLYRRINEYKGGYQPRSNLVKDENSDFLAYSHNNLNRWKNYFSQLSNVHRMSEVNHTEVHTSEPLVTDPSSLEVEIEIANLKSYKSSGNDQISTEPIKTGGETLRSEIHKLINSLWKDVELHDQVGLLLYKFTGRAIKLTVVIIRGYHCNEFRTKFYAIFYSQG